jgi:hypothetical protein
MKAKSLSFVFIYFSELGLFNALRRIQMEKTFPCASRRRHEQNAYRPNLLKLGHRWRSITGSIETIAHNSTFCKLISDFLSRSLWVVGTRNCEGLARAKEGVLAGLVPASTEFGATNDQNGEHGRRAPFCKPSLLVAAMSASSLRRCGVDSRDKPSQDGKRSGAQPHASFRGLAGAGRSFRLEEVLRSKGSAPPSPLRSLRLRRD